MRTSGLVKEERASKKEALKALLTLKQTEKRNFTEDEVKQFNDFETEVKAFDIEIVQLEAEEAAAARMATPVNAPAVVSPTGVRTFGEQLRGALSSGSTKQFSVASDELRVINTANNGDALSTKSEGFIESLMPYMAVGKIGPSTYSNVAGNSGLVVPRGKAAVAGFVAEGGTATAGTGGFDSITVDPKRLSATITVDANYAAQTSFDAEAKVIEQIKAAIGQAIDKNALVGAGTNAPVGIFANTDVTKYDNDATVDAAAVNGVEAALLEAGVDITNISYIFKPSDYSALKVDPVDTGSGVMTMSAEGKALGYPAFPDAYVPATKFVAGDGKGLHIAQWGSIRFTVDPFTLASKDQVVITANLTVGIGVDDTRFVIAEQVA